MMNHATFSWRYALLSAIAAAAVMIVPAPAAAQDETTDPGVSVDDGAPDDSAGTDAELLPAPDQKPLSRIVRAGDSGIESQTPPETTTDATFAAVPTTRILSSDLPSDGGGPPGGAFEMGSSEESVIPDRPIGSDAPDNSSGSDQALAPATSADAADPAATGEADAAFAEGAPASDEAATETVDAAPETVPAAGAEAAPAADEEAAEEDEAVEQTAAVPPIEGMIRIVYAAEASKVTDPAKELLAPLIARLNEDYGLRLKVLAYAEGDEDESTHARGVSLARALAMRDYLAEQGIGADRLDLKALGNAAQEEPADRVDLIAVSE